MITYKQVILVFQIVIILVCIYFNDSNLMLYQLSCTQISWLSDQENYIIIFTDWGKGRRVHRGYQGVQLRNVENNEKETR